MQAPSSFFVLSSHMGCASFYQKNYIIPIMSLSYNHDKDIIVTSES